MIIFQKVTYFYPGEDRPAIHNIDLEILPGEFCLVAGISGTGKSTLLRCVNGLVPHFSGGSLTGTIRVDGLDPVQSSPTKMSRHVGFVFQDPETQFVLDRVEDDIAFSLENAAVPPQEIRHRIDLVLERLELRHLRDRKIETLSGGERQRVAIAAALVFSPKILALDEPTSQLDPGSAEEVLEAILRLREELSLTVLISEHRLERVLPFTDRLVYLDHLTQEAISGMPRDVLPQMAFVPPICSLGLAMGWKPLPLSIQEAKSFAQEGEPGRFQSHVQIESSGRPQSTAADGSQREAYLQARGISVDIHGKSILRNVDLQIRRGEILTLMGRNGSGKTTLLRTFVGLQKPSAGRVLIDGKDVANRSVAEICRQAGYLPQDPNSLLFADRVYEELVITLRNHRLPIDEDWLITLLERFSIGDLVEAYPRDLSTGQRQRVALCSILVARPEALLLDEPTRGLDPSAKQDMRVFLQALRAEGKAILLVTHDVELVAGLADRVAIMEAGEIRDQGTPREVFSCSEVFCPQIASLFPDRGWLTVEDVLTEQSMISSHSISE